jgi:hypothetical protein
MKDSSVQIFAVVGVIILVLVVVALYMSAGGPESMMDKVEDSTTLEPRTETATTTITATTTEGEVSGGFELSKAQVDALVSLGVDPDAVPSSISAEQEICFVDALGEDRVEEIKKGDVPNAVEFLKAKSCI